VNHGNKRAWAYQHPLDRFLDLVDVDCETRLDIVGRKFAAQPFNAAIFNDELKAKLQRLRYPQPDPERNVGKKTFHEILERADVLAIILHPDTLADLRKFRLMKKIIHDDEELEEKKKSIDGTMLSEHKRRVRKINNDLQTLEEIAQTYSLQSKIGKLREEIARKALVEWRAIMISKYGGVREALLLGCSPDEISCEIRIADTAIQVEIYRALKSKLQNRATKKAGIFDRFLCQLAELLWAESNVKGLSNGETIRKASSRLPL
jgi:hypothetical protein